jgi:hypothetical protein
MESSENTWPLGNGVRQVPSGSSTEVEDLRTEATVRSQNHQPLQLLSQGVLWELGPAESTAARSAAGSPLWGSFKLLLYLVVSRATSVVVLMGKG